MVWLPEPMRLTSVDAPSSANLKWCWSSSANHLISLIIDNTQLRTDGEFYNYHMRWRQPCCGSRNRLKRCWQPFAVVFNSGALLDRIKVLPLEKAQLIAKKAVENFRSARWSPSLLLLLDLISTLVGNDHKQFNRRSSFCNFFLLSKLLSKIKYCLKR